MDKMEKLKTRASSEARSWRAGNLEEREPDEVPERFHQPLGEETSFLRQGEFWDFVKLFIPFLWIVGSST